MVLPMAPSTAPTISAKPKANPIPDALISVATKPAAAPPNAPLINRLWVIPIKRARIAVIVSAVNKDEPREAPALATWRAVCGMGSPFVTCRMASTPASIPPG